MSALNLNEENFEQEVIQSAVPVLVDFWAPWCGPCKAIAPAVESIAADMAPKLKVAKVNVDDASTLASRYSIMSIPSLLLFQNGQVVEQLVGLVSKEKIATKVQPYLG